MLLDFPPNVPAGTVYRGYTFDGVKWVLTPPAPDPGIPNDTVMGNVSGAPALAYPLDEGQLTGLINVFTPTLKGSVPPPPFGTQANAYVGPDGVWRVPLSDYQAVSTNYSALLTDDLIVVTFPNVNNALTITLPDGTAGAPGTTIRVLIATLGAGSTLNFVAPPGNTLRVYTSAGFPTANASPLSITAPNTVPVNGLGSEFVFWLGTAAVWFCMNQGSPVSGMLGTPPAAIELPGMIIPADIANMPFTQTMDGLVPAPGAGDPGTNVLMSNGTWAAGGGTVGLFTSTAPGIVPMTGGATVAHFLRADATWAEPIPNIANNTVLGNVGGIVQQALPLTQPQLTNLINIFTSTLSGAVPASGGGTADYLRADGTWDPVVPLAGGTMTGLLTLSAPPGADMEAANKGYVDEAVAAQALYQGTWDADTNDPDLNNTALHINGYAWIAITPDPLQPFTITAAIPGLQNVEINNGDRIIWSDAASEFQVVRGSTLSLAEAEQMFLPSTGGALAGPGNLSVGGTLGVTGNTAVSGTLGVVGAATVTSVTASGNISTTADMSTRDLTVTRNQTVAGTLGVTGATTVTSITGSGNITTTADMSTRDLAVTRNATVAGTLGVTGLSTLATLTTTGATNLATAASAVTIGSATNNATLTARGTTALAANAGSVTVGGASNTAADLTVQRTCNLAVGAGGEVNIGSTANNRDTRAYLFTVRPPRNTAGADRRPLLPGHDLDGWAQQPISWRLVGSYNGGIKIRMPFRLAEDKMFAFNVRVFGNYHTADFLFTGYLYGSATPQRLYDPRAVLMSNTMALGWQVIMGLEADGTGYVYIRPDVGGGNSLSWGGVAVYNHLAPHTGGNWNTGWEILQVNYGVDAMPNRYFEQVINFYSGSFLNYIDHATPAPGWTWYNLGGSARLDFNGREVTFAAIMQFDNTVAFNGNAPVITSMPASMRPPVNRYFPITINMFSNAAGVMNVGIGGYIALNTSGSPMSINSPTPANNFGGYMFAHCTYWVGNGLPPKAPPP